ncbi:MAG: PQ-loop repeat-containing protein [Coxiellaceae bacterium]|nr:PQ-loop repeat-containing protein [Coxiellaceae bacterium]
MKPFIGMLSLNISLVLYLINYIPQLWHNKIDRHISGLSFYFHCLFLLSYLTDLIYALGCHMQWQYCLVSVIGMVYLFIQHGQIKNAITAQSFLVINCLLTLTIFLGVFFLCLEKHHGVIFIIMGYFSRVTGWIAFFPQIVKNIKSSTALSLSALYLIIDLACKLCDNVSAWILSWPMPSKLGAIFSIVICSILIFQKYKFYYVNQRI